MSYIRSTSNPEGLYIWGDGTHVNITIGPDFWMKVPPMDFVRLIRKYNSICGDCPITIGDLKLEEVWVRTPHARPHSKRWAKITKSKYPRDLKIRLSYKGQHADMWTVTWEYICRHEDRYCLSSGCRRLVKYRRTLYCSDKCEERERD